MSIKTDNLDFLLWWIKLGTRVRLKLLKNAKELNGKTGVIVTKAAELVIADASLWVGVKIDHRSRQDQKFEDFLEHTQAVQLHKRREEILSSLQHDSGDNHEAAFFECCGGRICKDTFEKHILKDDPYVFPLCQADMPDGSEAAAVVRIRTHAKLGDHKACFNLGGIYDAGMYGVVQNRPKARHYHRLASEGGEFRRAQNLACSYRDIEGVPVDLNTFARPPRAGTCKGLPT